MSGNESMPVKLDDLNAKQRVKEYKNVCKEIKSKDLDVKYRGIEKLKDCRYLTEGNCLVPLVDSIAVKKKATDTSKTTLDALLRFLEATDHTEGGCEATLQAIKLLHDSQGNLLPLQALSNLIIFKEEVKKVKSPKKKKGEPEDVPPPIIESDLVIELRLNALRSLYNVAISLSQPGTTDYKLIEAFAAIPNFVSNLSSVLMNDLATRFNDPEKRASMIQEGIWALKLMCVLLLGDVEYVLQIAISAGLIEFLPIFSQETNFTLLCTEFYKCMSESQCGFSTVAEDNNMQSLLKTLIDASSTIKNAAVINAAPVVAAGKKDDKGKKGAEPVVVEDTSANKGVEEKLALSYVKLVVQIFTAVARRNGASAFTTDMIVHINGAIADIIVNKTVFEIINTKDTKAGGIYLGDLVDICVIFYGEVASIDETLRTLCCNHKVVLTILTVMQLSSHIVPPVATSDNPETDVTLESRRIQRLYDLRRVIGKTVLVLLTKSVESAPDRECRWNSCSKYRIDEAIFHGGEMANTTQLLEIIESDDVDASNHGCRLLCAILLGCHNPKAFCESLGLDNSISIISAVVEKKLHVFITELDQSDEIIVKAGGELDYLIPSTREALYYLLAIVELLLKDSSKNINTFTTATRVTALATILYRCGPAAKVDVDELIVSLYDPRNYAWSVTAENNSMNEKYVDKVILRTVVVDILCTIAKADSQFKSCSEELPSSTVGKPLPSFESPCAEASLLVCKIAGDACCSVLTYESQYTVYTDYIVTHPSNKKLHEEVLIAILHLMKAIGSCGISGVCSIIESIAAADDIIDENNNTPTIFPSMRYLKLFLSSNDSIRSIDGFDANIVTGKYSSWNRPKHFEDILNETAPTSIINLYHSRNLWPIIALCNSVVSVIASPRSTSNASSLAISALLELSHMKELPKHSQAVISDTICAVIISLGGIIAISGAVGRFGPVQNDEGRNTGVSLIEYICSRGSLRESFWTEQHELAKSAQEEASNAAAAAAPAAKGKDAKVDPKTAKGAVSAPTSNSLSILEMLNYLPEDPSQFVDPNHGPSNFYWMNLLQIKSHDIHAFIDNSTPLISTIQNMLFDAASILIQYGANVNEPHDNGLVPLYYSLLLNSDEVTLALINAGADVDHIDQNGNPLLKYGCYSLLSDVAIPYGPFDISKQTVNVLFGDTSLLEILLDAKCDVAVSDSSGNSVLHNALGVGSVQVKLGGYFFEVKSNAYVQESTLTIGPCIKRLIGIGGQALVNFCNKNGQVPLHIAAGQGDTKMIKYLVDSLAMPVVLDSWGYTPLHYTTAACPNNYIESFDILIELSSQQRLQRMVFNDERTSKSKEEKYLIDLSKSLSEILSDSLNPACIKVPRVGINELLTLRTDDGMGILQLAMCAHKIKNLSNIQPFVQRNRTARIELVHHITSKYNVKEYEKPFSAILSTVDNYQMNVLHAASLLFEGDSERTELTAQQKRSKKMKYYESVEDEIFDIILSAPVIRDNTVQLLNTFCTRETTFECYISCWYPLHASILNGNAFWTSQIIDPSGYNVLLPENNLVYFLASSKCMNERVIEVVLSRAISASNYDYLLNSRVGANSRPLTTAVMHKNHVLITKLLENLKVNVNIRDEDSGLTPFHEAIQQYMINIDSIYFDEDIAKTVSAFWASSGFDRTDILLGSSASGETCIDLLIRSNRLDELTKLFILKRNDVVERVLSTGGDEESLLVKLENDNINLARENGLDVEETDPDKIQSIYDSLDASGSRHAIIQKNNIIKIIAHYINEANLNHLHVHPCFAEGKSFSEYNGYNLGEDIPANIICNADRI